MKKELKTKREQEKQTVYEMIMLYCRKKHKSKQLCDKCQALYDYASARTDSCPFMENKTFCSNCKVHCYKPEMRERIKEIMRYSGPRMLFHKPVMAIKHVISTMAEKKNIKSI